jgi:hypothetical protein
MSLKSSSTARHLLAVDRATGEVRWIGSTDVHISSTICGRISSRPFVFFFLFQELTVNFVGFVATVEPGPKMATECCADAKKQTAV